LINQDDLALYLGLTSLFIAHIILIRIEVLI